MRLRLLEQRHSIREFNREIVPVFLLARVFLLSFPRVFVLEIIILILARSARECNCAGMSSFSQYRFGNLLEVQIFSITKGTALLAFISLAYVASKIYDRRRICIARQPAIIAVWRKQQNTPDECYFSSRPRFRVVSTAAFSPTRKVSVHSTAECMDIF